MELVLAILGGVLGVVQLVFALLLLVPLRFAARPTPALLWRLARRLLRSLRLRARVLGRVGTGDPCDTAQLWGAIEATRRLLPGVDTRELQVDRMDPALDLEGRVEGRVWPAEVAWIAAGELVRSRRPAAGTETRS